MIVPTSTYLAHRTEHYRTEHYRVHVTVNTTVVQWGRDLSQTNFVGGSVRGNYWRAKLGDTDTVRILKVLIHMKRFAEKDTSRLLLLVLILNVFDKGFRNVVDAREQGQRCLQPCFARSDAQFTRDQTLHSACVAVVRSGNERAVRLCKLSRFLTHRYPGAIWDVDLICDIWLCWSFQTNFMYDRFL